MTQSHDLLPGYDRHTVVPQLSGGIARGSLRAVAGPSSGKSTPLKRTALLIHKFREREAAVILGENISDARLSKQIAAERGLPMAGALYWDALSADDGPAPATSA